jgi:hypothetical protein
MNDSSKASMAPRQNPSAGGKGKHRYISADIIDNSEDEGPGGEISGTFGALTAESEYEREKRENIERNKMLLKDAQKAYEELVKDMSGQNVGNAKLEKKKVPKKTSVESFSEVCSSCSECANVDWTCTESGERVEYRG